MRRMRKENYTIFITGNLRFENADFLNKTELNRLKIDAHTIKLSMVDDSLIFYNIDEKNKKKQELNHKLLTDLYNIAKGKKFQEYIGIYKDKTEKGVSDANKKEKKILTFKQIN